MPEELPKAYDPALIEDKWARFWVDEQIFHVPDVYKRQLQFIADHGMLSGVVLNPATPVEMVFEVLPMVHHVLVMSVNPGFGGQKFLPRSVDRIAHLSRCLLYTSRCV